MTTQQLNRPYAPTNKILADLPQGFTKWHPRGNVYTVLGGLNGDRTNLELNVLNNAGWTTVADITGAGVLFFFAVIGRKTTGGLVNIGYRLTINGVQVAENVDGFIFGGEETGLPVVGSIMIREDSPSAGELWDIQGQSIHFDDSLKLEGYISHRDGADAFTVHRLYKT